VEQRAYLSVLPGASRLDRLQTVVHRLDQCVEARAVGQ
jgi:hypothetical protein